MSNLKNQDPDIASIIDSEVKRQSNFLELIASENFIMVDASMLMKLKI